MSLNELEDQALVQKLVEQEHALVRARFRNSMGRLENTASMKGLRKDIARIRTELRQREVAKGLPKNALLNLRSKITITKAESSSDQGGFLQGVVDKLAE